MASSRGPESSFPPSRLTRRQVLAWTGGLALAGLVGPFAAAQEEGVPPGADRPPGSTRIAFGSCLRRSAGGEILDAVVAKRPDLFLWLGDNIYADTEDLAVKRATYAVLGANPRFQRLVQACPNHAMWDDHDYGRDNIGDTYAQRDASQVAFCDFWRVAADDPRRQRPGTYHSVVSGAGEQAVRIIMLDGRYFRGVREDPRGTMLGAAQWAWLAEELRKPARLRVICSGVQVLAMPTGGGLECWNQQPRERQRLFDLVKETRAEGVLFLSGDRHFAELSRLPGALGYDAWDLTSSSLDQMTWPTPNQLGVGPQVRQNNFGMLTIDWRGADPRIALEIVDGRGVVVLTQVVARSSLAAPA